MNLPPNTRIIIMPYIIYHESLTESQLLLQGGGQLLLDVLCLTWQKNRNICTKPTTYAREDDMLKVLADGFTNSLAVLPPPGHIAAQVHLGVSLSLCCDGYCSREPHRFHAGHSLAGDQSLPCHPSIATTVVTAPMDFTQRFVHTRVEEVHQLPLFDHRNVRHLNFSLRFLPRIAPL